MLGGFCTFTVLLAKKITVLALLSQCPGNNLLRPLNAFLIRIEIFYLKRHRKLGAFCTFTVPLLQNAP